MTDEKSEGKNTVKQAILMFAEDISALTAAIAPTVVGYSFFGVLGAAGGSLGVSVICILLAAGVALYTSTRTETQQEAKFIRRLVLTLLVPGFGTYERHKRLGCGVDKDEAETEKNESAQ